MQPYLNGLIERMSDLTLIEVEKKAEYAWRDEVTQLWIAHCEAKQLKNAEFLPDLFAFVKIEEDLFKKMHGYKIIGFLSKNCNSSEAISFLMKQLSKEKEQYSLTTILDALGAVYKPIELDLTPIYKLTKHKNGLVRTHACGALTNSGQSIEPFLLDRIRNIVDKDTFENVHLLGAIMYVGTNKAIPVIEPYLISERPEIKEAATHAIGTIMLRGGASIKETCSKTKFSISVLKSLKRQLPDLTRQG